jgi:hypothetical protein
MIALEDIITVRILKATVFVFELTAVQADDCVPNGVESLRELNTLRVSYLLSTDTYL